MRSIISTVLVVLLLASCAEKKEEKTAAYSEKYRPQYHFSPAINWTNDPNGLVFFKGEYHLFYQYNPHGDRWGHMSWGHAVSPDLYHWKHLPIAIEEFVDPKLGDSIMIFSGSAVVDKNNTSGFFPNGEGMVAVFTQHQHRAKQQIEQTQGIAYSADGLSFTRYEGNPVLDINVKDFRDPKAFWYEPQKKWIMVTVIPDKFKTHLYESKDLKEWKFMSEFGPLGDTAKIWECPDLFELPFPGDDTKSKWVMIISNSHPQGPTWVGMQYFIGDFDGTTFKADNPGQYPLYLDYGKDYYAGVTFNNTDPKRHILLGWANNWAYGQDIPTSPWRSAMSMPRELSLIEDPAGLRLRQLPVQETENLKGAIVELGDDGSVPDNERSLLIEASIQAGESGIAGINLMGTIIGYDAATQEVFVDRTKSGNVSFSSTFPSVDRAPAQPMEDRVNLQIYFDQSILEVYINNGRQVITSQIFPEVETTTIVPYKTVDSAVVEFSVRKMKGTF